jgi:hypothetical protein
MVDEHAQTALRTTPDGLYLGTALFQVLDRGLQLRTLGPQR